MKEIAIKMPDEMYDWLVNGFPDKVDLDELQRILINGKPLPVGHRKEENGKVLGAVKENIETLDVTDMDSLGKMNAHLLNITMVLCDISRSLAFMADNERTVKG